MAADDDADDRIAKAEGIGDLGIDVDAEPVDQHDVELVPLGQFLGRHAHTPSAARAA